MSVYNLICERRSIRKFKQREIDSESLKKFVNTGRLAPSAANKQPLEFVIVGKKRSAELFSFTKWAGYVDDYAPEKGERPVAFIVILTNEERSTHTDMDVGLAAENIILAAFEEGIGSCCIGALDREGMRKFLNIPEKYEISLAIALGYPDEKPEKVEKDVVQYWLEDGSLKVPKRPLKEILHVDEFQQE